MTPARRLSIGLIVLALGFGGLDVAQRLGVGRGYSLPQSEAGGARGALALERTPFSLPSISEYTAILDRPLFNEDRKPTPVTEAVPGEGVATPEVAQPLNATLTSIIITPTAKLAIVKNNNTGESEVVRVGRPLTGDQAGWSLVDIAPRKAVFSGEGLGQQELELAVSESAGVIRSDVPSAPVANANGGKPAEPGQAPDANNAASQAHAEEIRRRIEERRRQLREEAERMRTEQPN